MTDSSAFPGLVRLIEEGIEQQWHHGVQVYISQHGTVLADFAVGHNAPDDPLRSDTQMLWLSSGKPITAAAILKLQEFGLLSVHDRVTRYVPEFGAEGKEDITLWHLLTHTAGLKSILLNWKEMSWDEVISRISRLRQQTGWSSGNQGAYDPGRSWFILAEIMQRVTGLTITEYLRSELLAPLGMDRSRLAFTESEFAAHAAQLGIMYAQKEGQLEATAAHHWETCKLPSPGSSLRGPAADLGKFYEMLLREGATAYGRQLLSPETIRDMTSRHRTGIHDGTFQHVVDFGLGIIINSSQYGARTVPYGFGLHASADSFGHGGSQSSIGFADPQHQLVVVMIANGYPGDAVHHRRFLELTTQVYEELGLS